MRRAATALVLLATLPGCPRPRPEPRPLPAPVAPAPARPAPPLSPAEIHLRIGRLALALGLPGTADLLYEEAAAAAGQDEAGVRARALYGRGLLALGESAADRERAAAQFRAAVAAEPGGEWAAPAHVALRLLDQLDAFERTARAAREEAAATDRDRKRVQETAETLRHEAAELRRQLDELKQAQLRAEAEKKGGSS